MDSKFTCSESGAPCPTVLRLSAKHKLPSPNLTWLVCVCGGGWGGRRERRADAGLFLPAFLTPLIGLAGLGRGSASQHLLDSKYPMGLSCATLPHSQPFQDSGRASPLSGSHPPALSSAELGAPVLFCDSIMSCPDVLLLNTHHDGIVISL